MQNKIIIVMLLFFFTSCSNQNRLENDEMLIEKIFDAIKNHQIQDLSLKNLTTFKWERVCVFPPYTSEEEITKQLGFNWDLIKETHIESDETITLIVFITENTVVKYLIYPRYKGDFSNLKTRCYQYENATFKVEERKEKDEIWFVMKDL